MYKLEFMEEIALQGSFESKELLFSMLQKQTDEVLINLAMKTKCALLLNDYINPLIIARGIKV
jgi:hypothetical protein